MAPGGSGEQGNVFRLKLEKSFLSNCFVMCVFISESEAILSIEQFEITAFVESEEGHSGTIFRIWRKKYPQVKTRRKLSVKLLCVM